MDVAQMDEKTIMTSVLELNTPVGFITVECFGKKVPFDIVNGAFSSEYNIYNESNANIVAHITAEANYQIRICRSTLKKGAQYTVRFHNGQFQYNGGDEHTISLTGTFGEYALGIGAYDPNDDEKMRQSLNYSDKKGYLAKGIIFDAKSYDTSDFTDYHLDVLDDMSGFTFATIDNGTCNYIYFPTAWIRTGKYDVATYESAVDFWIS